MPSTADTDLVWAAALFVGEGCASINRSQRHRKLYPVLALTMQDRRAVERFARALDPHLPTRQAHNSYMEVSGCSVREVITQRKQKAWIVRVCGRPAEAGFAVLWPYLRDTDKGDQINRVLKECGCAVHC